MWGSQSIIMNREATALEMVPSCAIGIISLEKQTWPDVEYTKIIYT